jgi:hypothetical protein
MVHARIWLSVSVGPMMATITLHPYACALVRLSQ